MATKLNRKNAAEFSFFLAVPTMAAANRYTLYKMMKGPLNAIFLGNNLTMLIVGNIVAFIVALVAIKFFIDFLTKHGFKAFGYYRIIVGGLLLILLVNWNCSKYNLMNFIEGEVLYIDKPLHWSSFPSGALCGQSSGSRLKIKKLKVGHAERLIHWQPEDACCGTVEKDKRNRFSSGSKPKNMLLLFD